MATKTPHTIWKEAARPVPYWLENVAGPSRARGGRRQLDRCQATATAKGNASLCQPAKPRNDMIFPIANQPASQPVQSANQPTLWMTVSIVLKESKVMNAKPLCLRGSYWVRGSCSSKKEDVQEEEAGRPSLLLGMNGHVNRPWELYARAAAAAGQRGSRNGSNCRHHQYSDDGQPCTGLTWNSTTGPSSSKVSRMSSGVIEKGRPPACSKQDRSSSRKGRGRCF